MARTSERREVLFRRLASRRRSRGVAPYRESSWYLVKCTNYSKRWEASWRGGRIFADTRLLLTYLVAHAESDGME